MNLLRFAGSWAFWSVLTALSWASLMARSDAASFSDWVRPLLDGYNTLTETLFSRLLNLPPIPGWNYDSAEAYDIGLAFVIIAPVLLTPGPPAPKDGSPPPENDLFGLIARPLFILLIAVSAIGPAFTSFTTQIDVQDRWFSVFYLFALANAAWHPAGARLRGVLLASKNLLGAAVIILGLVFAGAAELIA